MTTPSVWYDEAATISGAQRSMAQMGELLSHVDMVHGAYYVVMHYWFSLVGYTPFTLRLPSLLASGLTAGLVVITGWRLRGLRSGVFAAILFTLAPRTTYAAAQGRSYAVATLLVVAASLALVLVIQGSNSGSPHRSLMWAAYGALLAAATVVFVYTALVVVGHALYALSQRERRVAVPWFASAVGAGAVASPVVLVASRQTGQVSWLTAPTSNDVLVEPWSTQNALFAGVLFTAASVGLVVTWFHNRPAAALLAAWATGPIVIVALVSLVHPLYYARYVAFTLPAGALLGGAALSAIRGRALAPLSLILALGLVLPTWQAQRSATANDGHDWQAVAELLKAKRGSGEGTEVAVYGPLQKRTAVTSRLIASAYPDAFEGLRDLTIVSTGAEEGSLWGRWADPKSRLDRLSTADTVWIIGAEQEHLKDKLAPGLSQRDFHAAGYWRVDGAEVVRYRRR